MVVGPCAYYRGLDRCRPFLCHQWLPYLRSALFRISETRTDQLRPVRGTQSTQALSDALCSGLRDHALAANPCRFPQRGLDHKASTSRHLLCPKLPSWDLWPLLVPVRRGAFLYPSPRDALFHVAEGVRRYRSISKAAAHLSPGCSL